MFRIRITLFQLACILAIVILLVWLGTCKCGKKNNKNAEDLKHQLDSLKKVSDSKDADFVTYANQKEKEYNSLKQKDSSLTFENNSLKIRIAAITGKSVLPKYTYLRNEDSAAAARLCDSLADEYSGYRSLIEAEMTVMDSLLRTKDAEIENRDSLANEAMRQLQFCRSLFKTSIEFGGALYQAAMNNQPRNTVSIVAGAQYFTGTKMYAALLGFDLMNKRKRSVTLLGAVDKNGNYGGQVQFKLPLSFRKK